MTRDQLSTRAPHASIRRRRAAAFSRRRQFLPVAPRCLTAPHVAHNPASPAHLGACRLPPVLHMGTQPGVNLPIHASGAPAIQRSHESKDTLRCPTGRSKIATRDRSRGAGPAFGSGEIQLHEQTSTLHSDPELLCGDGADHSRFECRDAIRLRTCAVHTAR